MQPKKIKVTPKEIQVNFLRWQVWGLAQNCSRHQEAMPCFQYSNVLYPQNKGECDTEKISLVTLSRRNVITLLRHAGCCRTSPCETKQQSSSLSFMFPLLATAFVVFCPQRGPPQAVSLRMKEAYCEISSRAITAYWLHNCAVFLYRSCQFWWVLCGC